MANDFTNDPACVCLWRMESGQLTADSIGNNTLINSGAGDDTLDFKEGVSSADFNSATDDSMSIADASLDAGFPLKSDTATPTFSVCLWVALDTEHVFGSDRAIIAKFQSGQDSLIISQYERAFMFVFGHSAGAAFERVSTGTGYVNAGTWYHIGLTYDDATRGYRIIIWDDTAGSIIHNSTGTLANQLSVTAAPLELMDNVVASDQSDGRLDEIVWFDRVLSEADINSIRGQTYGAPADEVLSPSSLSATALEYNQVELTYVEGGGTEWAYDLEISWDTGQTWHWYRRIPTAANALAWTGRDISSGITLAGFAAETDYQFRMRGVFPGDERQSSSDTYSNVATTTTPAYRVVSGGGVAVWIVTDYATWVTARDGCARGDFIDIDPGVRISQNGEAAYLPEPNTGFANRFVTIRTRNVPHVPYKRANRNQKAAMGGFTTFASAVPRPAFSGRLSVDRYCFESIAFESPPANMAYGLVAWNYDGNDLDNSAATKEELPAFVEMHGCLVMSEGYPTYWHLDGVRLGCHFGVVQDCVVGDFYGALAGESHAVSSPNGTALWIANTELVANSISSLMGGDATNYIDHIRACVWYRNYHTRPAAWASDPNVRNKNLWEAKNLQYGVVEGCWMENLWITGAQKMSIVITPVTITMDGGVTDNISCERIYIRHNWIQDTSGGILIRNLEEDSSLGTRAQVTVPSSRIQFEHNIAHLLETEAFTHATHSDGCVTFAGADRATGEKISDNIYIRKNTLINRNSTPGMRLRGLLGSTVNQVFHAVIEDNVIFGGSNDVDSGGVWVSGPHGVTGLNQFFVSYTWRNNCQYTEEAFDHTLNTITFYPALECPGTVFVASSIADVGFVDYATANYRQAPGGNLDGTGSDGGNIGADFDAVTAAVAHSRDGDWTGEATSPGNDFSADPSCVCLWRMEDGALTEDSQGTNTLTNEGNNVVANTIDFKEGAASGEFDAAVNSRMRIADSALDSGFPYKSGETTRDMTICFWLRLDAVHDVGNYGLVEKFDTPSARSFDIEEESRTIRVLTGYNNGTQHDSNSHGGTLIAGQWYHVAYTFDHANTNAYRIRIWDDTAGQILQSPGAEPETDKIGNLISEISITAAPIYLMTYNLTNYSDGALDEIVWFNRPLSNAEIDSIRQGTYGEAITAPTYAPDQCWAEALNAGACEVWWSNVNSTDNCRVRIERATSPDGPWTFIANANQTIDPVTYAVEVTAATATEATLKRVNDGDFDQDWFFTGALIAVEAGGTMTPGARFRVNSIAGDFKTIKVATSENIGNTGIIARIDWMGLTTQDSYTDTTAPADTVLYYRLRTEASDGSDPTGYSRAVHFVKTPPDDQTPVIVETFDDSMPSLSGTVHRPVNGAQLKALLQPASGLSRGDVIELQSPTWFEGLATFQASDSSINRSDGGSWFTDGFTVGQLITIEGSQSNNGLHTIQTVSSTKLTLTASSQAISDETVTIQLWYTTYQTDWYYWQDLGTLSGDRDLDYVIIRGEDYDQLPQSGYRIDEASRRYMPIVRSPNNTTPAFLGRNTVNGAFEPGSYYYVHGIRFVRPAVNATVTQPPLVRLDSEQTEGDNAIEYDDIGHHFVFDQCWFDGLYYNPDYECIRGLIANANYVSVKNCWFQHFTRFGQDGQCILVNMSFGPMVIVNNTIYGDGIAESIMLGGGGNRIAGAGAAHVTMRSNRFDCHPEYDRRDPNFNFQPVAARTSWIVEVVSSDSDTTRLKMADDSQFPSSLYPRDRIRIETGGGITAGTYEVVDRSSDGDSTNILIDAPSETPGQQATLMRCTGYTKKNTFEIKNANAVELQGNILRRCPVSAQRGYPFVLTPKSHGLGRGPGGTVRYFHWAKAAWDFRFDYNHIEDHDGDCVIQLSVQAEAGIPGINTMSALGRRVLVEHNLYSDHSRDGHAGLFQVSVGTGENKKDFNGFITRHNTTQVRPPDIRRIWQTNHCRQGTSALASDTERPFIITGQWRANIVACGIDSYTCLSGTQLTTAEQVRTQLTDTNNYEWQDNVWIDSDNSVPQGDIPAADLTNAADYDAVGWKDWQNGDFELDATSPYKAAATPIEPGGFDDPGVDFVTLQTYLETVETGQPEVPVTSVFIGSRTAPPRLQGRADSNRIT